MSRIYDALQKAEQQQNHQGSVREHLGSADELFQPSTLQSERNIQGGAPVAFEIEPPAPVPLIDEQPPVPSAAAMGALDSCPATDWKPSPKVISFSDREHSSSVEAEQFRRLRSRLYQLREKQALKRILVSSALPGEGKTFVSANLAQALARRRGTRVLLIDADLRKPSLHVELGAPVSSGLSDYLHGTAELPAILQRGSVENLYFIPGGGSTPPADMLSGSRFQELMVRAAELFDWVIVDSSPVVPISDATVIAQHCDGVLLVVRAETTPFDLAQKAKEEFRNSAVLGVVLNKVSDTSAYTPYYYSAYKTAVPSTTAKATE